MNFDYLRDLEHFNNLYDSCSVAEELVSSYPDSSAIKSLHALDYMVKFIINAKTGSVPMRYDLYELMSTNEFKSFIGNDEMLGQLHFIRKIGQMAERNEKITKAMALISLQNLYILVGECLKKLTIIDSYPEFDKNCLKKTNENIKINKVETNILAEEFNLYKLQLSGDVALNVKPAISEAETRKVYIDYELNAVGWTIVKIENQIIPGQAGIEIRVEGMPNNKEEGYCDYVLYSKAGKPLAIIEAKRTSVSPIKGRQQVELYCQCIVKQYNLDYKPVLYYTNGYEINIIDQLGYPDRKVMGYMSYDELQLMINRQKRGPITDMNFDKSIADRDYQITALTRICEDFNAKRRKELLVLATGTGKTRTAISLVDILTRHDWIKNVLFLADRTSLVSQAFYNFQKLLPSKSMCVVSDSSISKAIDYDARVTFSTYQTIINMINGKNRKFGVGRFDLIIIDEAHRSIFNKYGAIFDYFDSLLVGLTATPRDDVKHDASTYDLFELNNGEPTFAYDLDEAVKQKYLTAYRCFDKTTERLKRGAKYTDLSEEDKKKYEEAFILQGMPEEVKGSEFFKKVYNKKTCDLVIQTLMEEGLKINNGDIIGKTIIFAYNHKHAEMIVERFRKLYPEYGPDFCQLIDNYVNYADSLVKQFSNGGLPQIAVSVDMLDTGIDAPDVLNLVFFKEVYSKIKFVQMIGRGTRLCKDLNVVSPSRDYFDKNTDVNTLNNYTEKQGFYIFDWCENFAYFDMHPDGRNAGSSLSLSQRLFTLKLDLKASIATMAHLSDSNKKKYHDDILKELVDTIAAFNRDLIKVKQNLPYVDKYKDISNWAGIAPVQYNEIKYYLVPLVTTFGGTDDKAKVLDFHCWNLEKNIFANEDLNAASVRFIYVVCDYLKTYKATIDEVLNSHVILEEVLSKDFFTKKLTYIKLEEVREKVRVLMKYIDSRGLPADVSMNISDEVIDLGQHSFDPNSGFKTYYQKVLDYLTENSNLPVLLKIKNLEQLNTEDLNQLEDILWNQLGTKEDYEKISHQDLPAFIRKNIMLNQEAINEKLAEYFVMDELTSEQQEFIRQVILFVKQNGDITMDDVVNNAPFADYDLVELFDGKIEVLSNVLQLMHYSIVTN